MNLRKTWKQVAFLAALPLLTMLIEAPAGAQVFFNPTSSYFNQGSTSYLSPTSIATADFNNDGLLDLIVVNASNDSFSYFEGTGGGNFAPGVVFSMSSVAGANPGQITIADFNGDGNLDVAIVHPTTTSNGLGNTVSVHLGDGNGGFTAGTSFTTGGSDTAIGSGDFNRDGKKDLVVASCDQQSVYIYSGNGLGTFTQSQVISVGTIGSNAGCYNLTVADVNKDGNLDIITSNSTTNIATVLLGSSTGVFSIFKTFNGGSGAGRVFVSDLNNDGKLDLAIQNTSSVSIFQGDGTGTFAAAATIPLTGNTVFDLAASDLNGDGNQDLIISFLNQGTSSQSTIGVFLGNGSGQFTSPLVGIGASDPNQLVVGDFDGDGRPDIAFTNSGAGSIPPTNEIGVQTNATPRLFASPSDLSFYAGIGQTAPAGAAVATSAQGGTATGFTLASSQNWLSSIPSTGSTTPGTLTISANQTGLAAGTYQGLLRLNAPGYFGAAVAAALSVSAPSGSFSSISGTLQLAPGSNPSQVTVGDFNLDGKLDLAVANFGTNSISVLLGTGSGGFSSPLGPFTSGGGPVSIAGGDFNGDGKLDLVVGNSQSTSSVNVLIGDGTGNFAVDLAGPFTVLGTGPSVVAVGDFNNDGKLDIAVASASGPGNLTVLLGDGNGGFKKAPVAGVSVNSAPTSIVTGDFNGDGNLDLATCGTGGLSVLFGLGNGEFGQYVPPKIPTINCGTSVGALAVADFNGDGIADLAVLGGSGPGTQVVAILGSTNGGPFPTAVTSLNMPIALFYISAADINGDGKPDVIASGNGAVEVLLGNGTGTFAATSNSEFLSGAGTERAVAADFNGDGRLDLAVPNNGSSVTILTGISSPTTTSLASPQSSVSIGTPVTLNAQVSETFGFFNTPTGTVTFQDGSAVLQTVNLSGTAVAYTTMLTAGSHSLTATYNGDVRSLSSGSSPVTVVVTRPAVITWLTPAAIMGGQALSSAQLNATADVAGTFVYTPAAGTVLPLGNNTLSVTFTPSNTTLYTSVVASVTLVVTNPGGGCIFTLSPSGQVTLSAAALSGQFFQVGVAGGSNCPYTASVFVPTTSNTPTFVSITSGGTGNAPGGAVGYSVSANPTSSSRSNTILVTSPGLATTSLIVNQSGTCSYSLLQANQSFSAANNSGTITVTSPVGCSWSVSSSSPFVTFPNGSASSGGSQQPVSYSISQNSLQTARTASLTIAGLPSGGAPYTLTYSVIQAGATALGATAPPVPTCAVSTGSVPTVALEGRTEVIGDVLLICSNLSSPITADIALNLNTPVTNAVMVPNVGPTDAALTINGGGAPQFGLPQGTSGLHWPGVVLAPNSSGMASVHITNVRADASYLTVGNPPASYQNSSLSIMGSINVGAAVPMSVTTAFLPVASASSLLGFQPTSSTSNSTLTLVYNISPSFTGSSPRVRMSLNNIPCAATLLAPVYPLEGSGLAQIYSADSNGFGGSPSAGTVMSGVAYQQLPQPQSCGSTYSTTATWQALGSSLPATLTFPILVQGSVNLTALQANVVGTFAPVSKVGQSTTTCSSTGSCTPPSASVPRYFDYTLPVSTVALRITTTLTVLSNGSNSALRKRKDQAVPEDSTVVQPTLGGTATVTNGGSTTATGVIVQGNGSTGENITSCTIDTPAPPPGVTCTPTGGGTGFMTTGPGGLTIPPNGGTQTIKYTATAPSGSLAQTTTDVGTDPSNPQNNSDLAGSTSIATVNTQPSMPTITWTPSPIVVNQPLGASQMNASATFQGIAVPGTYSYTSISGFSSPGLQQITVTFTPSDTSSYTTATLTVNILVLTGTGNLITFLPIPPLTYGNAPYALQANASSGLPVTFTVLSGPATVTGNLLTFTGVGTGQVQASQPGNASIAAATSVTQTYAISAPNTPTITWNPAPLYTGQPLGPAQLDATASVPGTFMYTPPAGTALSAGLQILKVAFTPSNSLLYQPMLMSVTILVTDAPTNVITFPPIPDQNLGDPPITLKAISSSGLPVSYAVVAGPGTLNGNVLTLTGVGIIQIQATQPGGGVYPPANPVYQSFRVLGPSPSITSVYNASFQSGSFAPNSFGHLFGTNFANATVSNPTAPFPAQVGGINLVLTDSSGAEFPLLLPYVSATQIDFYLPSGIAAGTATMVLTNSYAGTQKMNVTVAPIAPALFSADGSGKGLAAGQFQNANGQLYLAFYGTGFEQGKKISLTVGGQSATILFAGLQGQYLGLDQLNAMLPAAGLSAPVNVVLTVDGVVANVLSINLP